MLKNIVSHLAATALVILCSGEARAFSTRLHILIANKVREALIADGKGGIPLKLGAHSVRLKKEDVQALTDHPLAFRAGAVGPDNMAFPGMTDPSHAIEQRPFEQCELLYQAALTPEERAYAIGCFLHGATDAIAHHYVNFMSGETFTLNPISSARGTSYSNVVRHIIAESMIQKAALRLDADAFRIGQLGHNIPDSFVLRTYLNPRSALFALMARRAKAKFDAALAAMPGAPLPAVLAKLSVAPADHLILTPVYLEHLDGMRQQIRRDIEAAITALQNPGTPEGAQLKVSPGSDGVLGTSDDRTACSVGCPSLYTRYFTYIALLAPRYDAGMRKLPSALEKISEKLREDMGQFLPSYVKTIENISAKLNAPISENTDDFAFSQTEISMLFSPMTTWADNVTTLDYETLLRAVLPEWLNALRDFFANVPGAPNVTDLIKAIFQPFVQQIKDAIRAYAIEQAMRFLSELSAEYKARLSMVTREYEERLAGYAGAGLMGNALDHFFSSGLYLHSFNIAAAAIANHQVVLPIGDDPVGIGPASFDASHTPSWMQAGLCEYLRAHIFPLGLDVRALLTVSAMAEHPARVDVDSPVECHDGSLTEFTKAPSVEACALTGLAEIVGDPAHRGSPTRAYPPEWAGTAVSCQNITVDGLPGPPEMKDAGCACQVGAGGRGATQAASALAAALVLALLMRRRARRLLRRAMPGLLIAPALLAGGCGGEEMAMMGMDPMGKTAAQKLIELLGRTTWHGRAMREGKERGFELRFETPSRLWAEVRNPFGPARRREMRVFSVEENGMAMGSVTVQSEVISPADWRDADPRANGRKDRWAFEVIDGPPMKLRISRGDAVEEYAPGAWPRPEGGLTASFRAFQSGGEVEKAFCTSKAVFRSDIKYSTLFDFARGKGTEPELGSDVVAGARLRKWRDGSGSNRFAITDVEGFNQLGGTERSDQFNFTVRYRGSVTHPGGALQMRERNDAVEDAVWVFLEKGVGSNNTNDLFLEVHGFPLVPDLTVDDPQRTLEKGEVPIEIILVRCAKAIEDIDVEIRLGGGAYQLVGDAPTTPFIDEVLFPPAL